MADDYSANTSTSGVVPINGSVTGSIEVAGDVDWIKFTVPSASAYYRIDVKGSSTNSGTLTDPSLSIYDSAGNLVDGFDDDDSGIGLNAVINFGANAGALYVAVQGYGSATGTYTVTAYQDDYGQSGSAYVGVGAPNTGIIQGPSDSDVFRSYLHAGVVYNFSLSGNDGGGGTLIDPYLSIGRNAGDPQAAGILASDDNSGPGNDAYVSYIADSTASYYVAARSKDNVSSGSYSISVTQAQGSRMPSFHIVDFDRNAVDDILYRSSSTGALSTWGFSTSGTVTSGGAIGNPGANLRVVGYGDFNGDFASDVLFRGRDGTLSTWDMSNTAKIGGGTLGNPGAANVAVGTADYNLDGKTDILFYNGLTGAYATWFLNDTAILASSGTIGAPGAAWTYKATADFNADGRGDILFQNANGTYALWELNKNTILSGSGNIGDPGAGYFFKGTGDFNGDGSADILFQNANGAFATWDLNGTAIIGGGTIGYTPAGYSFTSIGDYNGDGKSDILFTRTSDGAKYVWYLNDHTISSQFLIGQPPAGSVQENGHGANGFGTIVFQDSLSSTVASWETGINSIVGGGTFGQPGSAYTAVAMGDFAGTGETDVLFRNSSGTYATWTTNGSTLIGGGTLGNPGSAYTFRAAADFNGDGKTDILFQNSNGTYATWDIGSASSISGGGNIGVAAGYSFAATGDINGDGKSDIIFKDASGNYAAWTINDTAIIGGGTIGNPGSGWTLKGTGDFNGDGRADILFQNTAGTYATWDLDGISIVGGGSLGSPGGGYQFAKIVDINGDGKSDVLFSDSSGNYASWLISDTTIIGGGGMGTLSSNYHVV